MNDLNCVNLKEMRRNIFKELIEDNPPFRAFCWDNRAKDCAVIDTATMLTQNIRLFKKQGAKFDNVFSRLLKIPDGLLYKVVYYNVDTRSSYNSPVGMALGTACGAFSLIAFHRVSKNEFKKLSDQGVKVIDWSDEFEVRKKKVRVESNTSAQR